MPDQAQTKKIPNKLKIYGLAILIYLLVNGLIIELLLTLLENQLKTYIYPIFPFTRLALLIITILLANRYIARRSEGYSRKSRPIVRAAKYAALSFVFICLAIGAFVALSVHDDSQREPVAIPELPRATPLKLNKPQIEE